MASIAFAFTFAGGSIRRPETGGVYGFAREAFGRTGSQIVDWLFVLRMVTGVAVVPRIDSSYVADDFPLSALEIDLVALGGLAAACAVNLRGIVLTGAVQTAVIGAIIDLLVVTLIVAGIPTGSSRSSRTDSTPSAPRSPSSSGRTWATRTSPMSRRSSSGRPRACDGKSGSASR